MPTSDQPDEPTRRLRLGRSQERILAARLLGERGEAADIMALERARNRELDQHVRRAIDLALREARTRGKPSPSQFVERALVDEDAYSQAFRSVAKMLVHELRDLVGFARLDIAHEVPDLTHSQAARSIERIAELLDAIEELGSIGARSELEKLNLSDLIVAACEREEARLSLRVQAHGPKDLQASGSPGLIDLALAKGIENAAESTAAGPHPEVPITVNWGVTDRDAWFAIIDDGAGLTPSIDPFSFGRSDKEGHLGVGLTLASKAMKAMSGDLALESNASGGATLRARWPLKP